jgi:hypothetical protein
MPKMISVVGLSLGAGLLFGQTGDVGRFVYEVRSSDCASGPARQSTGFRLKNLGIVTALHGVAGCSTATVEQEVFSARMKIVSFDKDNDLALLLPADGNSLPQGGLTAVASPDWSKWAGRGVTYWGYPQSTSLNSYPATVQGGSSAVKDFISNVPDKQRDLWRRRASPKASAKTLNMAGPPSGPGFSGGPIVDEQGEVLAVLIGGLKGYGSTFGVALPKRWDPYTPEKVRDLTAPEYDVLFDYEDSGVDARPAPTSLLCPAANPKIQKKDRYDLTRDESEAEGNRRLCESLNTLSKAIFSGDLLSIQKSEHGTDRDGHQLWDAKVDVPSTLNAMGYAVLQTGFQDGGDAKNYLDFVRLIRGFLPGWQAEAGLSCSPGYEDQFRSQAFKAKKDGDTLRILIYAERRYGYTWEVGVFVMPEKLKDNPPTPCDPPQSRR